MRVRNRKGAQEMLDARPDLVLTDAQAVKGHWADIFGNSHPIHIEVGCGKGQFITGMAQAHPDINYVAIDMQKSVLSHVLDKVVEQELPNVRLLLVDGSELTHYFAPAEISLLYLNFSDPWPKKRHEKRRLTYKDFLATYQTILPAGGEIHFKTDNRGLFEYSLASMSQYGMTLQEVFLDLHASDFEGNVLTEYEEKFSKRNQVIYRLEARFED
ncbi:tRNA (guanosine(46)-N7)-methyltransferase TrmB [Streptococcus sp. DD12]|uniref:tRNA (guanosine(46)-N7)-methyltransferase TrmB n=1 Tax=Streptococcus sp. DD12 TaxID=1777880 RepID=UPI00082EAF83|nr:tRNA (guanosine(46)-N7)-methyltransferase TrmB [Streptococcus sp. DD12]